MFANAHARTYARTHTHTCTHTHNTHTHAHTHACLHTCPTLLQVKWIDRGPEHDEVLVSISTDGRVTQWSIAKVG